MSAPPRVSSLVAPGKIIDYQARFGAPPAFTLRLLALFGGEGREEGVERFIAVVVPMKLAVAAQDQPRRFQALGRVIRGEQHVPGRQPFAARIVDRRLDQEWVLGLGVGLGMDEKTR